MIIIGHGIDLVEVPTIRRLLKTNRDDFLAGQFTEEERDAVNGRQDFEEYFAGRCAAKEAIAKALGTGFTRYVTWLDIQVLNMQSGTPYVTLFGGALDVAKNLGVARWFVSISHTPNYAIASATAVRV